MRHLIWHVGIIIVVLSSLAACTNEGFKTSNTVIDAASLADIDNDIVNQAPKVGCVITNSANPGNTRTVNTLSALDTFFAENPKTGEMLSFDCSQSQDENTSSLSFAVDTDYSPAAPSFAPMTSSFNLSFAAAGAHPLAIEVTDAEGLKRVKTFTLVVECEVTEDPSVDVAGISITRGANLNEFNYSINAASVGGGSGFEYSWDFNGDGVFDPYSMDHPLDTWTSSNSVNNVYTIFASTAAKKRRIGLKVRNSCQYETVVYYDAVFDIPNIDRTPAAQAVPKGYHYIQSDIRSAPATNQRRNGDLIVTQMPASPIKRVKCDYFYSRVNQKAGFSIYGMNWYNGGTSVNETNDLMHGMEMRLTGIPDTGTGGAQTYSNSNGVRLSSLSYLVSAADDGQNRENFNNIQTPCTIEVTVERIQGVSPCASNKKAAADFADNSSVIIYGEFNCPKVANLNNSANIAAENGKFFCEVAPSNQCVGGGGGGGGDPIPEQ